MDVPRGSRVTVRGKANKPLKEASVEIVYGETAQKPKLLANLPLEPSEPSDFSYVIEHLNEPQDLRFTLADEDGIRTRQPILLSIAAVNDDPPQVEVRLRGVGEAVTPEVRIPFEGRIIDEYGVRRVVIEMIRAGETPLHFPFKQDPNNRQEFVFSPELAAKLNIPEEVLDFQLLSFEMRKKREAEKAKEAGAKDDEKAPDRPPGESKDGTKAAPASEAKKATGKKPDPKKADEEDAKYQLQVGQQFTMRIIARDGCTLQRPNAEGYSTVFAFRVVTPEELRGILAARELIWRKNFEKIKDEVLITRESLAEISFDPPAAAKAAPGAKGKVEDKGREITAEDQRLEAFLRSQRAQQISAKNKIEVLEVAHQFDIIREELINNRLYNEELNERLKVGISDPLHRVGNEMFDELDKRLNDLISKCDKDFSDKAAREQSVTLAVQQADKILVEMNSVMSKMLEFEAFNEAIRMLREILIEQEKVNQETKQKRAVDLLK
jgi:hypothetical protein